MRSLLFFIPLVLYAETDHIEELSPTIKVSASSMNVNVEDGYTSFTGPLQIEDQAHNLAFKCNMAECKWDDALTKHHLNECRLYDEVEITLGRKYKLSCQRADFDGKEWKLTSDYGVLLSTDIGDFAAREISFSPDAEVIHVSNIEGKVTPRKTEYIPLPNEDFTLKAERATITPNLLKAMGDIEIESDKLTAVGNGEFLCNTQSMSGSFVSKERLSLTVGDSHLEGEEIHFTPEQYSLVGKISLETPKAQVEAHALDYYSQDEIVLIGNETHPICFTQAGNVFTLKANKLSLLDLTTSPKLEGKGHVKLRFARENLENLLETTQECLENSPF